MPSTAAIQYNLSLQDGSPSPRVADIRMALTDVPVANDAGRSRITLNSPSPSPLALSGATGYNLQIVNTSPVSSVTVGNMPCKLVDNSPQTLAPITLPPGAIATFPTGAFIPTGSASMTVTAPDASSANPVVLDILLR